MKHKFAFNGKTISLIRFHPLETLPSVALVSLDFSLMTSLSKSELRFWQILAAYLLKIWISCFFCKIHLYKIFWNQNWSMFTTDINSCRPHCPSKKICDDPFLQLILSTVLDIKVKEPKMLKHYFHLVQKDQFLVHSLVFILFIEIKY